MKILKKIAGWLNHDRTERALLDFSRVLDAAEVGDVAAVEKSLKGMRPAHVANNKAINMLMHVAVKAGQKQVVDLLLKRGASAEGRYNGSTYAETALQAGHVQIVNDLYAHVSSLGQTPSESLVNAFNAAQQRPKPERADHPKDRADQFRKSRGLDNAQD